MTSAKVEVVVSPSQET